MKVFVYLGCLLVSVVAASCSSSASDLSVDKEIGYCQSQALKTLASIPSVDSIPNSIDKDASGWRYTSKGSWTCGFWPGILWYLYEASHDSIFMDAAKQVTDVILPKAYQKARSHDMGFMMMPSVGHAYRLTGNEKYKEALMNAADSLAVLYNPRVGTILSWPGMVRKENWPHNTIIDNMMNLELLFWAARHGGSRHLYDVAYQHARTTMEHHFRPDYSCYHVAVYDTIDGHFIKGVTHQGLSDDSMWARGQAWAIYGFTMSYRETQDKDFLEVACKAADTFLSRLPDDMIPYWDFDDASTHPFPPKDASAAAVTASALLELSQYAGADRGGEYYAKAIDLMKRLSSSDYQARSACSAFLLHSVGHKPRGTEVDSSIMYADYYYLEALIRLKMLQQGNRINGF